MLPSSPPTLSHFPNPFLPPSSLSSSPSSNPSVNLVIPSSNNSSNNVNTNNNNNNSNNNTNFISHSQINNTNANNNNNNPAKTPSKKKTKTQKKSRSQERAELKNRCENDNKNEEKGEKEDLSSISKSISKENEIKRTRKVRELLESEKVHVQSLDNVVDNYFYPLIESKILPTATVRDIFSNIELIRNWNQTFLYALEAHLECGNTFGDLFMEMIPFMRQLYTQYNETYDHAMTTYEKSKKLKQFAAFLERRQKETNDTKDILTYLYLPVQRMLAYDSLLKDILNLTPLHHEDYKHLSDSLRVLRDIEYSATQRAEQRKNINKVIDIQNNLSDDTQLALPHRRYVYEGEALLINGKNSRERYCYLFNNLLVCCKAKKKGKLCVDFKEPLETINIEDLPDDEDFRYLFRLTSSANEYILSSPDKHHWMALINSCKKESKSEREENRHNQVEESSRESLINKILAWSKMGDSEQVLQEVKELAAVLEKYKTMNHSQSNLFVN